MGSRLNRFYKLGKRGNKDHVATYIRAQAENAYYIRTLAFSDDYYYLAAAFEIYAIRHLDGLINKVHNTDN